MISAPPGGRDRARSNSLVDQRELLEQLLARLIVRAACMSAGISRLGLLRAEIVGVDDGVHLDEIDDAGKVVLGADGELDDHGMGAQAILDHADAALEVGAGAVHLVDEDEAGNVVLVGLAPDRLGLRLDAGDGIEDDHATVEHAQRALDLDREVDVARACR